MRVRGHTPAVSEPACLPAPGPSTPPAVEVLLVDDDRAAGQARRTVREALEQWRLPGLVDPLVLAVSELVTNARRHGRPPVHLSVHRTHDGVRLDVHDEASDVVPDTDRPRDAEGESGRGLDIVDALGGTLCWDRLPHDGKVVHASFATPQD